MTEPQPRRSEPVFEYDGRVYVRPCGRGVHMLDADHDLYVEECVRDGYYRMRISFEPIPEPDDE